MNLSSLAVLVILFALVGLAVWRGWKKGAPCICGGNCGCCGSCRCGVPSASEIEK